MPQYRNNRSGEVVEIDLGKQEIVESFLESAGDDDWLWFYLARHVRDARSAPQVKDMIAFLADSFLLALGMGLRRPMIRVHWQGRRYKVYLSRRGTLCFKTGALVPGTHDPVGNEEYMGCLHGGRLLPSRDRNIQPAEQDFIDRLSVDPAGFLAECSKDMNRCCYCNIPLEDARSKEVGYGKICADRWGLPWGKSYDERVPSFAQLWARSGGTDKRNIRGICAAIRANPQDELSWEVLGDALQEAGYTKRPKMPKTRVTYPAAA